jgi:hypothetical protein
LSQSFVSLVANTYAASVFDGLPKRLLEHAPGSVVVAEPGRECELPAMTERKDKNEEPRLLASALVAALSKP